jgi:D-glycero-D-manno-heptose 1,7-bisphosphate phosphatase
MPNPQKAVFIDRDGTLIEEVNYLSRVEDMRSFPFAGEALRMLKDAGYLLFVITNQSGIGREILRESDMHSIHDEIRRLYPDMIDAFYFCPHLPCDGCSCRKPGLGMVEEAVNDRSIDLRNSWIVGDKSIDIETGFNAGTRTAMVKTGYGRAHSKSLDRQPDILGEDLLEVANAIVAATNR